MKKYEKLPNQTKNHCETTLYRIKALRSFGDVQEGDVGGYIESDLNLAHGGNCWVYGDAIVSGDAKIVQNAKIFDETSISGSVVVGGNAVITGSSSISGNFVIFGNTEICDGEILS